MRKKSKMYEFSDDNLRGLFRKKEKPKKPNKLACLLSREEFFEIPRLFIYFKQYIKF